MEEKASLAEYVIDELTKRERLKLIRHIEDEIAQSGSFPGKGDYSYFFNFGLNTTTWRLLVNKQILMRYERLFIEKQDKDIKQEKNKLEAELKDL